MQSVTLDVGGVLKQVEDLVLPSEEHVFRRRFEIHRRLLGYLHKISSLTFEKLLIKMQGSQKRHKPS